MLNIKIIKLELIPDPEMYLIFEKGKMGWVSYVFKWDSKFNNNCLKSFDPKQKSKQIIYLEANKLYG